tara:strand:- start:645 stop:1067 length:423 start_codon:yes stop_codon:yes gene_type:complete
MIKKLIKIWLSKDSKKNTPLFKFIEINGYIYILVSFLYFLFPQFPTFINIYPILEGNDSGWVRYFGFMGLAMGYYFVFMGRTQSFSLAVATVFSRVLFVPLSLTFLILLKELDFRFIVPVLITDLALGIGTLYFILKEKI